MLSVNQKPQEPNLERHSFWKCEKIAMTFPRVMCVIYRQNDTQHICFAKRLAAKYLCNIDNTKHKKSWFTVGENNEETKWHQASILNLRWSTSSALFATGCDVIYRWNMGIQKFEKCSAPPLGDADDDADDHGLEGHGDRSPSQALLVIFTWTCWWKCRENANDEI